MFGVRLYVLIGKFCPWFDSPARKLSAVPESATGM